MASERHSRFRSIVDENYRLVARTLRNNGVPRADLDDEVQRTFLVVSTRLSDVQQGAERSFVRQVAHNRASHARRSYARRREVPSDHLPERSEVLGTPEELAARKQMRAVLDAALAGMTGYPTEFCAFNGDHTPDPKDSGQSQSWEYQNVWTFFSQF